MCLASTHVPIPDVPNTNTIYAANASPAAVTAPVKPIQWWGWIIHEPVQGDPNSVIHVDSRYRLCDSPSWPVGYETPPISVVKGKGESDRARVPKSKRVTQRKGHQHQRECDRFQRAHWNDPVKFPHPVVIGERYKVHKVPTPTEVDIDMWNKRMVNGILYTYMRIDRNYKGVVKSNAEMRELETEHNVLSNFRTVRHIGKCHYITNIRKFTFLKKPIFPLFPHKPTA